MDDIILRGASNFRSLGGLPAAGGRRIRPHALMRAGRLGGLGDDDWSALARTGIATICDLRSDAERDEHPNAVPPRLGVREMNCDIRDDLRADPTLARMLLAQPTARGAERVMVEMYRRFPRHMGSTLSAVVDRLLEGGAPLLVHCSAGKDRTGFVIAMLLHALEVPEAIIREDYLASRDQPGAAALRASFEVRMGTFIPAVELRAAVDTVLDVRETYFDAAMEAVDAEFGSIRRYLEIAAGVDPARLDLLRARLLT